MKQSKETLKEYFETGDKPTQEQYSDLIDSYVDSQQEAGEANRRFVIDETGEVSVTSEQETPEYTLSEIENNKLSLLKDGIVVKEVDLTPYIDDTNLSRLISGTVDENGLATFTRDDDSVFTVDFSGLLGQSAVLPTNISYEASASEGIITSSTGSDAIIPLADETNAGLMNANFYEEGSWELEIGSYGFGYEYDGFSDARFIRIGNLVNFSISITGINTPTNTVDDLTQTFYINLPFDRYLYTQPTSNFFINQFELGDGSTVLPSSEIVAYVGNLGFHTLILFKYDNFNPNGASQLGKLTINNGTIKVTGSYRANIYTP